MRVDRRNIKHEGRSLEVCRQILNDQKILEVGTELPKNAKVDKVNKQSFEDFKTLYKTAIDEKCLEEYGENEDKKLWEDTAKEMFLKSLTYVPSEDMKSDGELGIKRESRRMINHSKKECPKQG